MSYDFRPATMEGGVSLLIGIAGTSGAGKTFSAMQVAAGIVGLGNRFAVIDTEAGRALHYSKMFAFDHCEMEPPFRPTRYVEAIRAAEKAGYKAIIIDSWSHVWSGEGGMHDWADEEMARLIAQDNAKQERWNKPLNDEMFLRDKLNSASWTEPKVRYKAEVTRLIRSKAHLIFCMRAEDKLIIEQRVDDRGHKKTVYVPAAERPLKDRYIPICCHNPEFMYELTLSLVVTPENPGVPVPIKLQEQHRHALPDGKPLTQETGRLLAEWARGGQPTGFVHNAGTTKPAQFRPDETIDAEPLLLAAEAAAKLGNDALTAHLRGLPKPHQEAIRAHAVPLRLMAAEADKAAASTRGAEPEPASDAQPSEQVFELFDNATASRKFTNLADYLSAYQVTVEFLYGNGKSAELLRFDGFNKAAIERMGVVDQVRAIDARVRKPAQGGLV